MKKIALIFPVFCFVNSLLSGASETQKKVLAAILKCELNARFSEAMKEEQDIFTSIKQEEGLTEVRSYRLDFVNHHMLRLPEPSFENKPEGLK